MCFDIVRFVKFVRSVASLDGPGDKREKGGAGALEVFPEGAGEDYLHAVEEDPAKKESSYLAARIVI
jgi:hypothetical protein